MARELDTCVLDKVFLQPSPLSSLQVINFYAGANQSMNVTCVGKVSFLGLVHLPMVCMPQFPCNSLISPNLLCSQRPRHYRDKGVRMGFNMVQTARGSCLSC